jgi:tetratricopeptide (TPR) repeat protein
MVMSAARSNHLPALLAAIRQQRLDGELLLEQNDGVRKLFWSQGELVYLQSEVAGEQFGNYLLRQGVLDYPTLSRILASEDRFRLGEKVVQWDMMTIDVRDEYLRQLQEQVMVNALEHPVHRVRWTLGPLSQVLSDDLHLQLDHRHFIWSTFLEAHNLDETLGLLLRQDDWAWVGIPGLLESLSDLPLTPATAYALSFLGQEPIRFETFHTLSNLSEEEAARILMTLWAVGGLILAQGELPITPGHPSPEPPARAATPTAPLPPHPEAAAEAPAGAGPAEPEEPELIELDTTPWPAAPEPPAPPPQPPAAPRPPQPAAHRPVPAATPEPQPANPPGSAAAESSPHERARSLYRRARQLLEQDRTGEAIRCLEQSVQLEPGSEYAYGVWLLLGQLRMTNPAWSTRAVNALQSAARLRPRAAEPWVGMGEVYLRKGFRTNAAACFHKAMELDPSVPMPPDADLRELGSDAPAEPQAAPPSTLFRRFKSILGGSDKD